VQLSLTAAWLLRQPTTTRSAIDQSASSPSQTSQHGRPFGRSKRHRGSRHIRQDRLALLPVLRGCQRRAKDDIERVRRKVSDITNILEKIKQLLDSQDKTRLSTTQGLFSSLEQCREELKSLEAKLDPGKTRKTMSRFGFRALKWPFTSKQVDKVVLNLEGYEQTFSLALQVDQT
jgi:hypothetical protein